MKLYLSGPIKGISNAAENFCIAKDALTEAGFEVVNPFDVLAVCGENTVCPGEHTDAHYDHFLRGDLIEMLKCDGVAMMSGWEASRGARIEHTVAIMVGMPVKLLNAWKLW